MFPARVTPIAPPVVPGVKPAALDKLAPLVHG